METPAMSGPGRLPTPSSQPFTAEEWLNLAVTGLNELYKLFKDDGWQPDCSLLHGLDIAKSQINEAAMLLRSETSDGWRDAGEPPSDPDQGSTQSATAYAWQDDLLLRWSEWTGGHLTEQQFANEVHDLIINNLLVPTARGDKA